jgi:hypothetical protein
LAGVVSDPELPIRVTANAAGFGGIATHTNMWQNCGPGGISRARWRTMDYFRSHYTRERFFIPSKVPKLGLDLARLYDESESSFLTLYGATHDGRDIKFEYSGGYLRATIAEAAGADAYYGIELLKVPLHVHGGLSRGQLCQHAGITINGERPPLPTTKQMIDNGWAELSGERSVFEVSVSTTQETLRDFIELLLKRFHCHIVQPTYDVDNDYTLLGWQRCETINEITKSSFSVVMGVDLDASELEPSSWLKRPDLLRPAILVLDGWTYGFIGRMQTDKNRPMAWAEKVEPKTELAYNEMRIGSISLYASYRQDDHKVYELLRQLDALIDEVYPATRVDVHDFVTGDILSSSFMHYDPVITHWIQNDPNRWLRVDLSHLPNVWPLQCDGLNGTKLVPVSMDEVRRAASKDDIA